MANESRSSLTRRDLMRTGLAAGAGLAAAHALAGEMPKIATPEGTAFRFAHLTDMHVKPERGSPAGYTAALQSLQKIDPAPEFLITGGDHVMDALAQTRQRSDLQWDMYEKVMRENTKLKTYPVLGNHDVWGWTAKDDLDAEPGFGKAMAMDRLGLKKSYYSFDAGGWHLVMLDNISRRGKAYFGDIDDEQTEWLKGDLDANAGKKPVCVVTHIPLVAACALFFAYGDKGVPKEFWRMGDNLMHRNVKPLLKILAAGNVKLCISGHIHLLDRVDFMGMTFICDGSVCGSWWYGPFQETPEGYGVFDLYPNGSFKHEYVTFEWTPPKG